jgi:hypothetical protein
VNEPIGKGCWHSVDNSTVRFPVPGCDDGPSVRQAVFPKSAVKDKLIAGGQSGGCGLVQFVQEKDSPSGSRQENRGAKAHPVFTVNPGQSPEVHRIQQAGANVPEFKVFFGGKLAGDIAFSDSRGSPNKGGGSGFDGVV